MPIKQNYTFNELLQKITEIINCGDLKMVTNIDYCCPVRLHNNHLLHHMIEIKCDKMLHKRSIVGKKNRSID